MSWGGRTRTYNFLINSQAVCQLTYAPSRANRYCTSPTPPTKNPPVVWRAASLVYQRVLARSPGGAPIIRIIRAVGIDCGVRHDLKLVIRSQPGQPSCGLDARRPVA